MRKFVIVALLLLLPVFAFGADKSLKGAAFPEPPAGSSFAKAKSECRYFMEGSSITGVTCRDKCLASEQAIQTIEVMDGEHKGTQVCLKCFKTGIKDSEGRPVPSGQVPCSKKK